MKPSLASLLYSHSGARNFLSSTGIVAFDFTFVSLHSQVFSKLPEQQLKDELIPIAVSMLMKVRCDIDA